MISEQHLTRALVEYLPRQRWFAGQSVSEVTVEESDVLRPGWPSLVWYLVKADGAIYQLLLGVRPEGEAPAFLGGHDNEVLGILETDKGAALVYNGLLDAELALALLDIATPDTERAERVRPITTEQSNSSLVFDDRIILKVFRRLNDEPNLDVEVTNGLVDAGFDHVPRPFGVWRRNQFDLAFAQEFLAGGVEGWAMALTSLRDLYEARLDPAECGGDFAAEAERLGLVTARLHLAMAEAFGSERGNPAAWAEAMDAQLGRVGSAGMPAADLAASFSAVRHLAEPGQSIRVHGDYHLGQAMRTEGGWYILDFEGEPLRSIDERRQRTSPFKDVAGLLRSLHYATAIALHEQPEEDQEELLPFAAAWEARNRYAYLTGYTTTPGIGDLIPKDPAARHVLLRGFEVDKAVYEIDYERHHRPELAHIPAAALERLGATGDQPGLGPEPDG